MSIRMRVVALYMLYENFILKKKIFYKPITTYLVIYKGRQFTCETAVRFTLNY